MVVIILIDQQMRQQHVGRLSKVLLFLSRVRVRNQKLFKTKDEQSPSYRTLDSRLLRGTDESRSFCVQLHPSPPKHRGEYVVIRGFGKRNNSLKKKKIQRGVCEKDTILLICSGDTVGLWTTHIIKIFLMTQTFLPHLQLHRILAHQNQQVDHGPDVKAWA